MAVKPTFSVDEAVSIFKEDVELRAKLKRGRAMLHRSTWPIIAQMLGYNRRKGE